MKASKEIKKLAGLVASLTILLTACGSNTGTPSESAPIGKTEEAGAGDKKITVTNIYSQPKQLSVGDALYVDLNNSSASLDFEGVDSSAEFSFALVNASASAGSLSVTMSGNLSDTELDLAKEVSYEEEPALEVSEINEVTENFHKFLRGQEEELEVLEIPQQDFSAGKSVGSGVSAVVSMGESRSFKVLSSLSSTRNYVEVNGSVECVGSNVIFYVDSEVTQEMLSDADILQLCNSFDPVVAREQSLFGAPSDVDGNGKVVVLFTPQVNRLGGLGGGIITGFFLANDLFASGSSNPASNFMEILYVMVPDPQGRFGTTISRSFAMSNLLPSVLPHELQHAINYNQHVFVYGGRSENSCLNEGLSHLAEDLMGQGQENPSRYGIYLQSPQSYSVVSCSSAGLGNRGGSYLFLRYLYEQAEDGNAFARNLIQSAKTGIENVEAAFKGRQTDFDQFGEFFLRWSVAITGITQDSKFSFKARERDSTTGQWKGACVVCSADDGRSTRLNGVSRTVYHGQQNTSTVPAAVRFFKIANIADKIDFRNDTRAGEGYGVLIRTK